MRYIAILLLVCLVALVVGLPGKDKDSSPSFCWLLGKGKSKYYEDSAAPSLPAPRSPRDYFATSDDESTRYSFDSEASSSRQASRGKAPVHDQWRDNNEMATTNHDHHASETTEEEITEAPKSRPYFMHGRQIGGPDRKPRNLIKPPRPSYSTGTQAPVVGFFGWYSKPSRSKI